MRKIGGRFGASARVAALIGMLLAAFSVPAQAQTYTVLHNFGGAPDGANPVAPLIRDAKGNLYGTTLGGF